MDTEERFGERLPSFRVILSAGTRPLKPTVLELATDGPMSAALRKKPRGHRRTFPLQMTAS